MEAASEEKDAKLAEENLGPALLAVCWVFAAIATAVIISRYYVRIHILRRTRIDDWLIFITYVCLPSGFLLTVAPHFEPS
jgi:TRAP-type C4-dicarboxylate transport system permease small subunit